MSTLNELIKKLCPDGVEYKRLGEVATISRGGNFQKKDFSEQGVPCIHYGQIYTKYGLFAENTFTFISEEVARKQKMAVKNDIVMAVTSENIEDVCKCLAWLGDEDVAVSGHSAIIHHTLDPKYLVYYFHSTHFYAQKRKLAHGIKVIEVTPDKLNEVTLPVPPLKVQCEIVRTLDSLTLATNELIDRLMTEFTARKKQYEFYRDKLLKFEINVKKVPVREVIRHSCSGATPAKGNSAYYDGGTIPWIRTQDVCFNEITKVNSYITEKAIKETAVKWIPENCVIVAISGATAGRCAINKIKATTNQHCLNMEIDKEKALYKYVYYCLCSKQDELISKKQGARGDLNASLIMSIEIPVPNLEIQKKIVAVLDNFDAICTDLNIGLPAEIEARQKQYEYYRDSLLTFIEKGNIISAEQSRAEQSRAEQSRAEQSRAEQSRLD